MAIDKELQKYMAREATEPIKFMVQNKTIDPDAAISLVAHATGQFSDEEHLQEYKRFKKNSGEIFKNEITFKAGYDSGSGLGYIYRESSLTDMHFLFKLHQYFGDKDCYSRFLYNSPKQLKNNLNNILENKEILELGCGPGFGLKTFGNLGAKAVGVELREDYKEKIPNLDIKYGDAINLDEMCKGQKFDIIYSYDVFAEACIKQKKANEMAKEMYNKTKDGGYGFHFVKYEKFNPIFKEFSDWLQGHLRNVDSEWQRSWYDNLDDETKEDILWTNKSTLDPQYLVRTGFKIKEYTMENGDLVIVTKKAA
ncbi:MAG: class I SAM-dependent methyltransferase [Candidatus Pacearchaeota archaeon]|jgi:SAM-dependent methyltransferase|nr:class I SAM-dependent methyltransferase [Candidatus Pacearchaeota archaeon]|tara:strand:+ start:10872 stop:11801 length:930 start_codon:yes stop_codon:yes gene_type:complete